MKQTIFLFIAVFGTLGAYIPLMFGDTSILSGWSILGGMIGGFFGIWLAVWLYKRLS